MLTNSTIGVVGYQGIAILESLLLHEDNGNGDMYIRWSSF